MATSLQYSFPTIDADYIIREAFERCGILNYMEDAVRYQSARRSLNFLFQNWPNLGFNLFTLVQGIIEVQSGKSNYALPATISKLLQCKEENSNQMLGGSATATPSGTGSASGLFATTLGSFVQSATNGSISYLYPTPTPILVVGVQSAVTATYQLAIECSYLTTPGDDDWITILETEKLPYVNGAAQWFYLPFTNSAVNWRIREFGGATLNLNQIYLGIPYISLPMQAVGNDLYFQYPSQSQQGQATTYWIDRTIIPTLNTWPVPDKSYQFFHYLGIKYIQDVGDFFNSLNIGPRFLEAAAAGLAAKLAEKFAPDRLANLAQAAEQAYIQVGKEDTENVQSQVVLDGGGGW